MSCLRLHQNWGVSKMFRINASSFDAYAIPDHNHEGLLNYFNYGILPGSFLQAVLRNDLRDAYGRADYINRQFIGDIVSWLEMHAPSLSWGSEESVQAWVARFKEPEPCAA